MINRTPYYLPQREHIVAMWSLEERDATIRRSSLDYNHLSNIHGSVQRVKGVIGNAIRIENGGDYLTTRNTPGINITGEMTISARFNISLRPTEDLPYFFLLGKFSDIVSCFELWLWWYGDPTYTKPCIFFEIYNSVGINYGRVWNSGGYINLDTWHHAIIVLRLGGGVLIPDLFIDDNIININTDYGTPIDNIKNVDVPLKVGNISHGTDYFPGCIDEVILWGVALTNDEITNVFDLTYKPMQSKSFII